MPVASRGEIHCTSSLNESLVVRGHPSEKYEFVNWDDDIPFIYGKINSWQPNHQPGLVTLLSHLSYQPTN